MASRITIHANPLLLERGVRGVAGQPMEIVVHLPTSPGFSTTGFELNSAFPGPHVLGAVPALLREADARPEARLLVFGHADEAASEGHNKQLADRRGQVLLALLTQDMELFDQVSVDDAWRLIHYQAILKQLGLEPMPVDDKPGPVTARGTRRFQQRYNAAAYHPSGGRARAHADLIVDGKLGQKTQAALRDSYLNQLSGKLDRSRFFGPSFAGCGEFNRMGSPEQDRRAVLVLYRPDFPTESKIPCKAGDADSCKLNRKANHPWKCNFYRRTIEGETSAESKLPSSGSSFKFSV